MDETRSGADYSEAVKRYRKIAENLYQASLQSEKEPTTKTRPEKKGVMSFRNKTHSESISKQMETKKSADPSDKFIIDWFLLMRKLRDDKLED